MAESAATGADAMLRREMRDGVLVAVIDMPGRAMNVFSWALMDAFEALMQRVREDESIRAVVLTSGKPSFLAGADLDMVRGFASAAATKSRSELHRMCGRLGRLFNEWEDLPKPTVAAINGLAFGGGLEVCLASQYRIAADDPRVELALPEVKLGLMAAAGGTQRAPRLAGVEKGLSMLLSGAALHPREAMAVGLIDDVAPRESLVDRAVELARAMAAKPGLRRMARRLDPGPFDFGAPDAVARIAGHFGFGSETISRYPAYAAAIRAVIEGSDMDRDARGDNEMDRFVDLMKDPVAGRMIAALFINRQKLDKLAHASKGAPEARFAVAGESAAADGLRAALLSARAPTTSRQDAGAGDVVIAPSDGDLALLETAGADVERAVGVVFRRSRDHGAVLEIVARNGADVDKALALARRLRATPFLHRSGRSLLIALADAPAAHIDDEDARLDALSSVAAGFDLDDDGRDAADVACIVGGVFPAWSGGPFARRAARAAGAKLA